MSDSELLRRQFTARGNGVSLKRRLLRFTSSALGGPARKPGRIPVDQRSRHSWARIATVGIVLLVALFAVTAVVGAADNMRTLLTQHTGSTSDTVVPSRGETGYEVLLLTDQSTSDLAGKEPEPLGAGDCTYGKGYWKNHSTEWPIDTLTIGGVSYDQGELLTILGAPTRGDATYILASQLVAAMLNVVPEADSSAVDATIAVADAWLATNPLGSDPTGADRQAGIDLAETLDDYNSGIIGPGSCDDEELTVTMTPTETMTPTISVTTVVTDCTGANPQPHATTLAAEYRVTYDEIMAWKCSGFGFGEIEHAYTLSQETGDPVEEIFNTRLSGLGWGQITKLLLDGEPEEGGQAGSESGKKDQDNSQGKKDKDDKVSGNRAQGGKDKGGRDSAYEDGANDGGANNGKDNNGIDNRDQGNKDQGHKDQGNNGGGKKNK